MNHSLKTAGALTALLVVAGCADGDAEPAPTVTVTETVEAAPPEPEETEEAEEIEPEAEESRGIETNERGNVPMPQDGPIQLINLDTGAAIVEWTATDIVHDVNCTNVIGQEDQHNLMALDVDIDVLGSPSDFWGGEYSFPQTSFTVVDHDGEIVSDDPTTTSTAINCIPNDDALTRAPMREGQSASGTIIAHSPIDDGFLVLNDYEVGEYYEWEFSR